MDFVKKQKIDFFKKHVDTVIILTGILGSLLWMNGKFNEVEKDIAIIKTVLVMQKIMPADLCTNINLEKEGKK